MDRRGGTDISADRDTDRARSIFSDPATPFNAPLSEQIQADGAYVITGANLGHLVRGCTDSNKVVIERVKRGDQKQVAHKRAAN